VYNTNIKNKGGIVIVKKDVALLLAIILAVVGIIVYAHYYLYGRTAMAADIVRAKEYLWRARSTVDLEIQADYMQKSLEALKDRTGNPNWLYGFPDTDFSLIKNDLQTNINMAREVAKNETKGSYGYQRAIDNMQEACVELNEHLDAAIGWCTDFLPFNIILNVICWIVFIILVVIYLITS